MLGYPHKWDFLRFKKKNEVSRVGVQGGSPPLAKNRTFLIDFQMNLLRWGHLFVKSMSYKNPDIQHRNLEISMPQTSTASPPPHPHTRFSSFCVQKTMCRLCSSAPTAVKLLKVQPRRIRSSALDQPRCAAAGIVMHISKQCYWKCCIYQRVGVGLWGAALFWFLFLN